MANSEACELYIQQEIADGLAEGKKPGKIGKEVSAWVKKVFEVHVPPRNLEQRARRWGKKMTKMTVSPPAIQEPETPSIQIVEKSATNVATPSPTTETPSIQAVEPQTPSEVVIPQTSAPDPLDGLNVNHPQLWVRQPRPQARFLLIKFLGRVDAGGYF